MMQSFILMAVVTVLWALYGYSIAFSEGTPLFGDLRYALLRGVGISQHGEEGYNLDLHLATIATAEPSAAVAPHAAATQRPALESES